MTDVVTVKIIFDKNFISVPLKLAVAALESVRVGCLELIADQFLSQGQKISLRRIHLQNLRCHPDGSSCLVKATAH